MNKSTSQAELARRLFTRHGYTRLSKRPGTYVSWAGMIRRCFNSKSADFKHYGGRGITVCLRWREFTAFLSDMGERPNKGKYSLDRLDSNGNYSCGKCEDNFHLMQVTGRTARKAHDVRDFFKKQHAIDGFHTFSTPDGGKSDSKQSCAGPQYHSESDGRPVPQTSSGSGEREPVLVHDIRWVGDYDGGQLSLASSRTGPQRTRGANRIR